MRPAHAAAIGLVAFGLVKAAIVLAVGPRVGLRPEALAPIALAWACGPLAAGWAAHRWRERRKTKKRASPSG